MYQIADSCPRRRNGLLAFVFTILLAGCGGITHLGPTTTTPIKHVIIVVGENRSFDNLFATYKPKDPSQQVFNLLSEGIVVAPTGAPGPNFAIGAQHTASDTSVFEISPEQTGSFSTLPQPSTTVGAREMSPATTVLPFTLVDGPAVTYEPGLLDSDQSLLSDGGIFPQLIFFPDSRFPATIPNGPFPLTQYMKYSDTAGDPMHRFHQMWQQIDCSAASMSSANPSGCAHDLYPWVATTVGWGPVLLEKENTPPPSPFTDQSTWQGSVSMGFYNMAGGDAPYLASLADQYALSDNYHQFILGGTGPNSISIGTADVLVFRDANGNPATPVPAQVENPDPYPGSNNWYKQEGFANADSANTSNASYTNCSDPTQPGVPAIMNYLNILPYKPFNSGNCDPGAYYLVNNQYPAYVLDGTLRADQTYSVGPSLTPTIGDELSAAGISWRYYGEGYHTGPLSYYFCDICNPFEYSKSIMTTGLRNNIQGLTDFYSDLQNGTLPAVSFIKPDSVLDGHPGSSIPILYEAFLKKLVTSVQAQTELYKTTVIFITTDESGGTYDSGYIQPIDFFGDGPRIPLIAVSPYAKPGYIDHTYGDHASLLKFIEANWRLKPLSSRSRDNLPNPSANAGNPYVPANSPALGDLMTMFDFTHPQAGTAAAGVSNGTSSGHN